MSDSTQAHIPDLDDPVAAAAQDIDAITAPTGRVVDPRFPFALDETGETPSEAADPLASGVASIDLQIEATDQRIANLEGTITDLRRQINEEKANRRVLARARKVLAG